MLTYPLPDPNPLIDLMQRLPAQQSGYEIGASLHEGLADFAMQPGFQPFGYVRPTPGDLPIPPNGVYESSIHIPPGSFLLGYTWGSSRLLQGGLGFKFNIFDTGSSQLIFNRDVMAVAIAGGGNGNAAGQRQPYWLDVPYAILGTLNVILTNLDGNTSATPPNSSTVGNDMQLLLFCAVPTDEADAGGPGGRLKLV